MTMPTKKTHKEFITQMAINNPRVKIIGQYINGNTKVKCECKKCGYQWEALPYSLLQGHGCKLCGHISDTKARTKSQEQFVDELKKINPNIKVIGEYITARKTIKCECERCGNIWYPIAGLLLKGRGCPKCCHTNTSFVEQCIYAAFCEALGDDKVLSRNTSAIGKELDIYIPSLRFAIEPGAWYWHKDKIEYDKEKMELCKKNNIDLRIVYDRVDENVSSIPFECLTYAVDLSDTFYQNKLIELIETLFAECGITVHFALEQWNALFLDARIKSRRKDTEEFVSQIAEISPEVLITGEYTSNYIPIECECKICGFKWKSTPSSLLRGTKCKSCTNKRRSLEQKKTHQQFVDEVKSVLPDIEVNELYLGSNIPIECTCKMCGNTWKAIPNNLVRGHGCRKCSYEQIANKNRKSEGVFLEQLSKNNPNVKVLGKYIGADYKIKVQCTNCERIWDARTADLLRGKGCSKCSIIGRASARKRTNEQFVMALKTINPSIIPIEEYINNTTKIKVKCLKCDYEWMATPHSLLQGNGCRKCAVQKNSARRIKPVEQYSLNNEYIKTYKNAKEASEMTGTPMSGIKEAAQGKRTEYKGFIWKYKL